MGEYPLQERYRAADVSRIHLERPARSRRALALVALLAAAALALVGLVAAPSSADSWDPPGNLWASHRNTYRFALADDIGESVAVDSSRCPQLLVGFDAATGGQADVVACETADQDPATCDLLASFAADNGTGVYAQTTRPFVKVDRTAAPSSGTAEVWLHCGVAVGAGGSADGVSGSTMSDATLEALANLRTWEGLDPSIPWRTVWVNPYIGSDSNPGTRSLPLCSFAAARAQGRFGTRVVWDNAERLVVSPLTFRLGTAGGSEGFLVGESVSYTGGTARVLDWNARHRVLVLRTLSGDDASTATTDLVGDASGATVDLSSGVTHIDAWESGCVDGGGGATGSLPTLTAPAALATRVVARYESAYPDRPPVVFDGNGGYVDATESSCFSAAGNAVGAYGIANVALDAITCDNFGQSNDGKIKLLNVECRGVINQDSSGNYNCLTTHNTGFMHAVNVYAYGYPAGVNGAPVAPTSTSTGSELLAINVHAIADLTRLEHNAGCSALDDPWDCCTGSGTGSCLNSHGPYASTGTKQAVIINGDFRCANVPSNVSCTVLSTLSTNIATESQFAHVTSRSTGTGGGARAVSFQMQSNNPIRAYLYQVSLKGGARGIQYSGTTVGGMFLRAFGLLMDGHSAMNIFNSSTSNTFDDVVIEGNYDGGSSSVWCIAGGETTACADPQDSIAEAQAAAGASSIFVSNSAEHDGDPYDGDELLGCADPAEACFGTFDRSYTIDFGTPLTDYLPVEIRTYQGGGSGRNIGAR